MGIVEVISRKMKETAVYWGSPVNNGYGGKTFAAPVEIECRWENSKDASGQIYDKTGQLVVLKSVVYVNVQLEELGYLFLGSLSDISSDQISNPKEVEGAYEIKRYDEIPELNDNTKFLRIAYLGYQGGR